MDKGELMFNKKHELNILKYVLNKSVVLKDNLQIALKQLKYQHCNQIIVLR